MRLHVSLNYLAICSKVTNKQFDKIAFEEKKYLKPDVIDFLIISDDQLLRAVLGW